MKNLFIGLFAVIISFFAQAQELPKPSPLGSVEQRVGLTDIKITYSRPSAKERVVFGELVAYDKLWRTGANASTKISFSTDVIIGGITVQAGEYSFYTIPGKDKWKVILNSNLKNWGTTGYSEEENVIDFDVTPMESSHVETLEFGFNNIKETESTLRLSWEKVTIAFPIKVEVAERKAQNVEVALKEAGRTFRNAASFYAGEKQFDKAIENIDIAIKISPDNWYTQWVKAEIIAESGDMKTALKEGKKAIELGDTYYNETGGTFTYKESLNKTMDEWKSKK